MSKYPGIRQFDTDDFDKLDRDNGSRQHNIMMIVGNGFDISVLQLLGSKYITDYQSFFHYLKSIRFDTENFLYREMDELRARHERAIEQGQAGNENWSDFEKVLQEYVSDYVHGGDGIAPEQVLEDLNNLQTEFSKFLDLVVTPEILDELDRRAQRYGWAYRTFARFLADLSEDDYRHLSFPGEVDHFDLFNFNIINLNFTSLLDNYLYLDRFQFDPHIFRVSDRNFEFRKNPRNHHVEDFKLVGNCETGCSAYLMTEIFHPHGMQQIPRSLLFGVDADDDAARLGTSFQLEKPYWAQNPRRFKKFIQESSLFIIFGSSRGESDRWWWRHIIRAMRDGAELIIYQYVSNAKVGKINKEKIKEDFINDNYDAGLFEGVELSDEVFGDLLLNCFVVLYSDPATLSALGFEQMEYDPRARETGLLPKLC